MQLWSTFEYCVEIPEIILCITLYLKIFTRSRLKNKCSILYLHIECILEYLYCRLSHNTNFLINV